MGVHTIVCKATVGVQSFLPTNHSSSIYWQDQVDWTIEIRGVSILPGKDLIKKDTVFEAHTWPEGDCQYQWYVENNPIESATDKYFTYTAAAGDSGQHSITVEVSGSEMTAMDTKTIYLPAGLAGGVKKKKKSRQWCMIRMGGMWLPVAHVQSISQE